MNKIELNLLKLKAEREGVTIHSHNGSVATCIEYNGHDHTTIEFTSGAISVVEWSKFIKGQIKDPYIPNVYEFGYIGQGRWSSKAGTKGAKSYKVWTDMIKRCRSPLEQERYPKYKGCSTWEGWADFQAFADWYDEQKGAYEPKWALDKDLVGHNNKIYGPDTCFLLPPELNGILLCDVKRKRDCSDVPQGTNLIKHRGEMQYLASMNIRENGKVSRKVLGYYHDKMEAFQAYKNAREARSKEVAQRYKGKIEDRAYDLLMNFEVKNNQDF